MKIIAHRCGTDVFAEQTIAAARHSLSLGTDLVEVDIRFTRDQIPVVIHDPTPLGLYGCDTPICDLTAEEFLALRRVKDPSVCGHTFLDYLNCGIRPMLFHCKEGGERLQRIVDLCREYGIFEQVVFGVESLGDVDFVKSCGGKVLAFMPDHLQIARYGEHGADYIRLWQHWCTVENLDAVHQTGKKLWIMSRSPVVGEVHGDTDYAFFTDCGADGVLVNRVEPALAYYRR